MEEKKLKIEELGYADFFEADRVKLGLGDFEVARVISEHRGAYRVKNANGEFLAKVTGKDIFKNSSREDFPAVGDWVVISELDSEKATIHGILKRMTVMKRKYGDRSEAQMIATNVDVAFVVEAVDRDFNLNRIGRYSAIANDGGVQAAVVLNKTDLISKEEVASKLQQIKERFRGVDVIPTSLLVDDGLSELREYMKRGKTYCFLGSSGVGKSSLINSLLDEDKIRTGQIGSRSGRGKHTTTAREMFFLKNGAIVIDNPGMREIGLTDSGAGVEILFDEITALAKKCKFVDCTHIHESGCAVLKSLDDGELDRERYTNFISLKKETAHYSMNEIEKKEKDRQFGKFLKEAKKDLKKYKHKDYDD